MNEGATTLALGHDAGHFGATNAHLRESNHPLCKLFPTTTMAGSLDVFIIIDTSGTPRFTDT